jgi:4-amino-4-deoxy-L-arabinose transferase-like glycosyltransferase
MWGVTASATLQPKGFMTWLEHRAVWVVAILGLALLLAGDWMAPLIDRDEPRFAEASREMRQRQDFILPRFNGAYRFDKPPLIYWCQVAACAVLGENELAVRLPSAVFATGTAVLLALWGRRLGKARAGFFGGLIFITCLQVLIHGRLAVADMPMVFFFTAAVWSGWEMTRVQGNARWWWVFYGSLALGFLAKGPEAWLPLAGLGIGRWRRPELFRLRTMDAFLGMAFCAGVIALWAAPALIQTHGEFFTVGIGRHVIHRSFGVMEGHGLGGWLGYAALLPFFFVTFFLSFFPWSIWVPAALWKRSVDDLGWFLLTQAGLVFAVFTVVATKLPHYTLPAFPCLALWLAFRIGERRVLWGGVAMAALMAPALFIFHWFNSNLLAANLWREAKPYIRPETRVASVQFEEPSLVWEFRRVSTNYVQFVTEAQAEEFWRGPGPRCLVMPTKDWVDLRLATPTNAVVLRANGLDTASFRRWDMTAVARP